MSAGARTAIVTGASRGIGRAIALRLAMHVDHVALWARDGAALAAVVDELGRAGGHAHAHAYVVDVRDARAVDTAAARMRAELPRVGIVVNNAGSVVRRAVAELSDDDWRAAFATNVDGTFHVTRAFLPDLTSGGGGRIINIASRAGREGTPMLAAYCAAKHAVVGFTRALAEEMRAAKVCVNAICPGSVDTGMLREGIPGASPDMTADDVARAAEFLAVHAPTALTGSCIDIFG